MSIIKNKTSLLSILIFVCFQDSIGRDSLFFFKAKSDIIFQQGDKKESYTAHIRYNTRDTLWISFTGSFGIEGARLLITRDSTYIINKLEKTAFSYSNEDGNDMIPFPFSFEDWNLILLGKPYSPDSTTQPILEGGKKGLVKYHSQVSRKWFETDRNIFSASIIDMAKALNCHIESSNLKSDWRKKTSFFTQKKVNIYSASGDNVQILLNYVDYQFNEPQPFLFNFAKYQHVEEE